MRSRLAALLIVTAVFAGTVRGAEVITDGTMEVAGITSWPHSNVTAVNGSAKATDWKRSGLQSLKGTSAAGNRINVGWANAQTVGTIRAGDVVTLDLAWAAQYNLSTAQANGTLFFELQRDGGAWTTVWSQTLTPSTTRQEGTVAAHDVSASITATGIYAVRLRFAGRTGNIATASVNVWWDDVRLDVTTPVAGETTVGDGADPADAAICSGARELDAFTLQTNAATDALSSVTVTLSSGSSAALALVEVTNDAGTTVLGSIANPPSDVVTIPASITATTSLVPYRVRIAPKAQSLLAGTSSYPVSGTVTAIASANAKIYADTSSATIAIDNTPPADPTWSSTVASDGAVSLAWSNPAADFASVILLRASSPVTAVPAEGANYNEGDSFGGATVRHAGTATSFSDIAVVNGTTYHYRLFARDTCGNYSAGSASPALKPEAAPQTTTVGDGTDPAPSSTCPGGAARPIGAFTLQTTGGTDAVTDVTVTLSGDVAAIWKVEIVNAAGTTVYGSATDPASAIVTIPVSGLGATTTLTSFTIRMTPRSQASMPAGSWTAGGRVTAVGSANEKIYGDDTGTTVTIDNQSPEVASWTTRRPGNGEMSLAWGMPAGATASIILRRIGTAVADFPAEGSSYVAGDTIGQSVVVYAGTATTYVDPGLVNDTEHHYRVYVSDACLNYSAGVASGPLVPTDAVPATKAGTGLASVDSCNQITVRVPFSGDKPINGTTMFEYATSVNGPWSVACGAVGGASPRSCALTPLTPGGTYYIRVTFQDPDGVTGQNPQIVGPWTTAPACTEAVTTAATAVATVSSCNQITVSAPLSGDGDGDGHVRVEYNTSNSWPGTVACAKVVGGSPRQCVVARLTGGTSYWIRVSYVDADGVSGAANQVLGPLATPACGTDSAAPMVVFMAPGRGATIGGTDRAKVQVWDAGGLAASTPVRWSLDDGTLIAAVANANYACGTGCAIYEFDFDTAALANGEHHLTVQATDAAGNIARSSQPFTVNNGAGGTPRGGGTLLRRTHSSQLCVDCHAVGSHSSQTTRSTKFGNWGVDCLTCHTPHLTANVGLIREVVQTPNSGAMDVTLRVRDRDGGTNPQHSLLGVYDATGAPFNDGVCETCHTQTANHRNDGSANRTHYQAQRCTECHVHTRGFKATGCVDCHSAPPIVGKHRTKHDEVWDSTSGKTPSSYNDSTSHASATQYGYACAKCHAATHENDKENATRDGSVAKPWLVEVLFQGRNAGATYSGSYNASREQGSDGLYYSYSNGTCSGTYCHSNAAPLGGTNVSVAVSWEAATVTTCNSCHKTGGSGDAGFDATALSRSHAKHLRSSSGEVSTYAYGCDECHAATIRNGPASAWAMTTADLGDKRVHVDETKTVAFSTTLLNTTIDQSAGMYSEAARTCGGTYCHSPGNKTANFDPPNQLLAWGSTAGCHSCHGGNAASAAPISTAKHANHVSNAALLGVTFSCDTCHSSTVTGDATMSGFANHVDGSVQVNGTRTGTWTKPTCATSRCHSSGERHATPQYYAIDWVTGSLDCKGCHGRHSDNAFASIAGEPNYVTNLALSKYNSHRAHVSSATDCANCHAATVSTSSLIDGTTPSRHLDIDATPDVVYASRFAGATYNASTRGCTVSCHGAGAPVWGGPSLVCLDCHGAASDRDDWDVRNNVPSLISTSEWTNFGHGRSTVALPGTNPCVYCHSPAVGHSLDANPFRLANLNATGDGANSTCLVCHKTGSAGYNPGSGLKVSSKKINAYHHGNKHGSANGGRRCWDCHDPHGDGTNVKMIGRNLNRTSADEFGLSATRTGTTVFTANTAAANFVTQGSGITATGVCNVCHTATGHYTATGGDGHGTSAVCTSCHAHSQPPDQAFAPVGGGGDCLACHGTGSQGPRRPVGADFANGTSPNFRSHHVGNGLTMGGTVTNFDCIVCHAEGKLSAGEVVTDGQPHMDGKINLRNADSATAYYTYDKDAVRTSAGTNPASWNSSNAVWRTQTSTQLDPFCLTCHDADGATAIASIGEAGATTRNPFKNTAVTNNYDQMNRGGTVDVKSKVTGNPPPQGTFSRHAIRGQSTSIYTKYTAIGAGYQSMYEGGLFVTNMGTDENGRPNWNDASVMGCADCHTTDGANGAAGNAHGAPSEYLLKDDLGTANKGTLTGTSKYVCFRCHASGTYATGGTHSSSMNNSDYADTVGAVGTARTGGSGSGFGMACTNCHGGAPGNNDGTNGYGWIHGTNQVFNTATTGVTREARRFTNGGSLRFYNPSNWSASSATGCYTLAKGASDQWGGCTQHATYKGYTRKVTRPITY